MEMFEYVKPDVSGVKSRVLVRLLKIDFSFPETKKKSFKMIPVSFYNNQPQSSRTYIKHM